MSAAGVAAFTAAYQVWDGSRFAAAAESFRRATTNAPANVTHVCWLCALYGMRINGNRLRGARFGPRVAKHQELALKHGVSNPRVQYLLGMCQFHTAKKPAGWQAALRTLLKAEKLCEAEGKTTAVPLDPRWGYDRCLTFPHRTYERLGQRKDAVDHFRKALAMHPANHLAKEGTKRAS